METRRRYSIAEHGWKGEETVGDRKKHKKEENTHPTQQAKKHLSNAKAEHKTHEQGKHEISIAVDNATGHKHMSRLT